VVNLCRLDSNFVRFVDTSCLTCKIPLHKTWSRYILRVRRVMS
jgi:hypothetical protein